MLKIKVSSILQKLFYLFDSLTRIREPKICPFCGSLSCSTVDKKYMVTSLMECQNCHLYFRHPYETMAGNKSFYQSEYKEKDKITADTPTDDGLKSLLASNFNTAANKNADRLLDLFRCLFPTLEGVKIVDYGASWGYISYQFQQVGMAVQSFEISTPRADYGNKNLGLKIITSVFDLQPSNDIFFSSHVIEHVPSIQDMLTTAENLSRSGGYFIALCPNGSDAFRNSNQEAFHRAWGQVHPNYLSDKFFKHVFKDYPFFIGSSPIDYEAIKAWNQQSQVTSNLDSVELLVIVKYTQF